jgi:protein-S-isoprenylcysteine O-methyltransferase Ste14
MFSLLVPLVFVVFARPTARQMAMGIALVIVGEAIRIWAAGCISKNAELACKGPFAYVRNPLYFGSLLIGASYCAMSGLWWSVPITAVMYYYFYVGTIVHEEEHLRAVLGDAYARYCDAVPRLMPRVTLYQCDGQTFSWERVWYNREYQSMIGVVLFTAAFIFKWLTTPTLHGLIGR